MPKSKATDIYAIMELWLRSVGMQHNKVKKERKQCTYCGRYALADAVCPYCGAYIPPTKGEEKQ